ncbi:hypothetical protein LDO26_00700 [Luteimonas sp. BDR2-5]|uniref:hypothetical protein n=1 Tax=Proluteimonas luteida TaxID=2878685 RepID=UPI001E55B3D3|nr:hypothetical protein [Luteimonas sp. BDR2-5]MCD9026733.1 hypothetical protein [Luteimonas sp. BDR2-5]
MTRAIRPLLTQAALTLVLIVLALFGYDRLIAQPAPQIGVIDLNAVYREKEAEFTRRVTQSSTEAERAQAMDSARAFAQHLPRALEALSEECECLVLLSTALVTPTARATDLTPHLRKKLDSAHGQSRY